MWNPKKFIKQTELLGEHFVMVKRLWGLERLQVSIVNVYALCDDIGMRRMWKKLCNLIKLKSEARWCVLGNFNAIKAESERKNVIVFTRIDEMLYF